MTDEVRKSSRRKADVDASKVNSKLGLGDVANNLTTTEGGKVLDARQGATLLTMLQSLNPINRIAIADLDANVATQGLIYTAINTPTANHYYYIMSLFQPNNDRVQIAYDSDGTSSVWIRKCSVNTWTDWVQLGGGASGVIPITGGGTGATTVAGARNNLGLGNTAGALPIANGGTGATAAAAALSALGGAPAIHDHTTSQIKDFPASMPASDVYSWAKQVNKPAYTYGEVGAAAASHKHSARNITRGKLSTARLPFKYAYGTIAISGSASVSIDYSSARFTTVPKVLATYATSGGNWSGDNGAIKVHSKTTTGCSIVVGGSFSTARGTDWLAIGT